MLKTLLDQYKVVLGSKSPRRQQFLKDLGLDFTIKSIDWDEIYPEGLKKEQITEFLAQSKSKAVTLEANHLLITADTIVWCNGKALEKPVNKEHAIQMLQELSGNTHQVITSVCLRSSNKIKTFSDVTKVFFNELSLEEIEYYIDQYKPFDKAGSYGIQEWIGKIGVYKIEGSYANVVGLPVEKLYNELKKF